MFNFKKGGIFTRSAGYRSENRAPEKKAQVLAVWGSSSSGKTTVSVKLAKHLADKRKNVVLLLCDSTTPMLPCICPPSDLDSERSLGSILAATHVTDNLIRQNCILHKRNQYLTIIGMLKGENEYTYPAYTEQQAAELLEHLHNIAPYIIIDCGSAIANDILSAVSLMQADAVLRLVSCDLKSISYLSSQLPLLKDNKWDADKQIKAVSNIKLFEASENVEQVLGNVSFKIPHSEELEQQVLSGDLFGDLGLRDSLGFRKEIEKISKEVFGI
jgi:MinD-like ATPase involved in chromosome partitioning or flagellar assembly